MASMQGEGEQEEHPQSGQACEGPLTHFSKAFLPPPRCEHS